MPYPTATFGDVVKHRKEFVRIDDLETYKRARVQVDWRGIVLRDQLEGAMIKTKQQQVARDGELLVAEIDAKVGGIGIVPPELDGALVSSHYFLFEIDQSLCLRTWLDYYVRSGALEEQIKARGSTNYAAIRPHHVLAFELPLPGLPEQRRIVARIEELSAKIEEARRHRSRSVLEFDALLPSARNNAVAELRRHFDDVRLGDICFKITDGPHVSPRYVDDGVPFISVRNITESGLDFTTAKYVSSEDHEMYSKKANVESGDLLYTKGGTTGVARRVDTNRQFSIWVHVALLKLDRNIAEAGFVEHMLNAPTSKQQAEQYTRGSSNRDLGLNRMSNILFPLPPLEEQRRIVAYLDDLQAKADNLKNFQEETAKELDALMPSILSKAFSGHL